MEKKFKTYRIISITLIVISIIGFIFSTQKKENAAILEKRGNSKDFNFSVELKGNTDYSIEFWVVDEEKGFQWATVSAYAEVIINDTIAKNRSFDFSESEEQGGIKRAQNGLSYTFKPERNTKVQLNGIMDKGDYWEWKVYEGIAEKENMTPGFFVILLFVSIFIFFRSNRFKA